MRLLLKASFTILYLSNNLTKTAEISWFNLLSVFFLKKTERENHRYQEGRVSLQSHFSSAYSSAFFSCSFKKIFSGFRVSLQSHFSSAYSSAAVFLLLLFRIFSNFFLDFFWGFRVSLQSHFFSAYSSAVKLIR